MTAVLPYLAAAILVSTTSQVALRIGMRSRPVGLSVMGTVLFALRSPAAWIGSLGQVGAMCLWLIILGQAEISLVYPSFIGGGMVCVMIASVVVLGEKLSLKRLIGTVLMLAGIALAAFE